MGPRGPRGAHERPVFPAALVLAGQPCLVVGGGQLATMRVEALLAAEARVSVAGPALCEPLQHLAAEGRITHHARAATPADVEAAFAVFFCEDDLSYDRALAATARRLRRLVNVTDVPAECNFYMPAVVRRGPVTIGISTGGASPLLARRLRELIEDTVGPEYGRLAEMLGGMREEVKAQCLDPAGRAALWQAMLDSEAAELLRRGESEAAAAVLESHLPEAQHAAQLRPARHAAQLREARR